MSIVITNVDQMRIGLMAAPELAYLPDARPQALQLKRRRRFLDLDQFSFEGLCSLVHASVAASLEKWKSRK